jgi:hypothetical protein
MLRACWEHNRQIADGVRQLLDLTEVTFIDENGEKLLSELSNCGAEFVTAGVATSHLVESLASPRSSTVTVYRSARQPRSRKHRAFPKNRTDN